MNLVIRNIFARMRTHNTLLCGGLDPDLELMPTEILETDTSTDMKVLAFLYGAIDALADHVCAFKAQKAFFDLLPSGHDLLRLVVAYIHQRYPDISVLLDCKIGDTGNTMRRAYVPNVFDALNADGVLVNPYMGDDPVLALVARNDKAVVVLSRTSNPGADIVQDVMLADGRRLWEYILDLAVNRWNTNGNIIPVISSTATLDLAKVRGLIPDQMPILFAGVGEQGGDYSDLRRLVNSEGIGVLVGSSRGILYPTVRRESWQADIEYAAEQLQNELNIARGAP